MKFSDFNLLEKIGAAAGIVGATMAVGGTIANGVVARKAAKKLDTTVNVLAKRTEAGIADDICKAAVDAAAARAIDRCTNDLRVKAQENMRKRINEVVDQEAKVAAGKVTKDLEAAAENIDTQQLANDIRAKVAAKIAEDLYERYRTPIKSNDNSTAATMSKLIDEIGGLDSDFEKTRMMQAVLNVMKG